MQAEGERGTVHTVAAEEDPGDEGRLLGPLRHLLEVVDVEPPRRRRPLLPVLAHAARPVDPPPQKPPAKPTDRRRPRCLAS